MTERGQWRYGPSRKIAKSNLRRGDIVFFKESGMSGPITHIALYSGNGYIVHASSYYGKVVESKMKYVRGYFGAKRLRLNWGRGRRSGAWGPAYVSSQEVERIKPRAVFEIISANTDEGGRKAMGLRSGNL